MIATYDHHSPSGLNLFAAEPAMFVLERVLGLKQLVGVPAHRGSAVEDGVTHGLMNPGAPLPDCLEKAHATYDLRTAMSGDPRKDKYREDIPAMVETALHELRKYGVPSGTQGRVDWRPEGLRFPIWGLYDYAWEHHGILADLKTTERMPSEIKVPHARQVALYAGSDNIMATLVYVTPKKIMPYRLENIRAHREALKNIALRVENFLDLSDDPNFFLSITVPDVDSFYWANPAARQVAFEMWGI